MKIEIRENTQQKHLTISDISDRLYIGDDLWISIAYDKIRVGVANGGAIYELQGEELVKVINNNGNIVVNIVNLD